MISSIFSSLIDSIHAIIGYFFTFKYYPPSIEDKKAVSVTWRRPHPNCPNNSLSQLWQYSGFGSSSIFSQFAFVMRLLFPNHYGKPFRICLKVDPETDENFKGMDLSELTLVNTLGQGGFSKVHLVRRRSNSRLYALKVMEKPIFTKKSQRKYAIAERDILLSCKNPYIVRLYRTFRDSERLYMLMEFCTGNELWTLIHKKRWLSESTSKYYCAAVLEAVEYLHLRWIAHRDLKPENVIIDFNERPKLIDFGFAKKLKPEGKTYSFCGTPQYLAPEMILHKGHDIAVDLWALGVLLYEMLTGSPPFVYQNDEEIYDAALRGFDDRNVNWPSRLSQDSIDLIQKLCQQEPTERLGYENIQEVRKHKWFKGFQFENLRPPNAVSQTCRECLAQEHSDWYTETFSKFDANWDSVF